MIQRKIAQYIQDEQLFSLQDKLLVALSGGADSVALLHVLLSLGYTCEAAHCNFHLRGEESDRDEEFVRNLCHAKGVSLHTVHFETERYAAEKKISIEMAARELRYEWFEKIKSQTNASFIAVAHHQDDSVETLLLNLIRGTGIQGLMGIRPRNGAIVRPMLCVSREEVIGYLRAIGQEYVTDSTNLQDEYTRNKIRLTLLPLMEEINPSVKSGILATSNHLSEVFRVYTQGIEAGKSRVIKEEGICIETLLQEPSPENLLFEILYPLGFAPAQIKEIFLSLRKQSGKQFPAKNGWRLIKDRKFLLLTQDEDRNNPPFELIKTEMKYTKEYVIPRAKDIACFDADKLKGELSVRRYRAGDAFIPFGMKGKKLLSDYMTDRKFSLDQKEKQWLLCCDETIAWVIGERTDNRFRIDENTTSVVEFRIFR